MDGCELVFEEGALKAIAKKAYARKTGARGLRSIIEEILMDIMFELPSMENVKKCYITEDTVTKGKEPTLVIESETQTEVS